MSDAEILLTPDGSSPEDTLTLSGDGRVSMRKRILPKGEINYKGQKITFDEAYLSQVAEAFQAGAYDHVPVQIADAENRHNNDPERFGGEITGVEVAEDGLYGVFSFTERGAALVRENPKLGVSARLVNGYERSDGKKFSAAMQHCLLTQDPRIPGLGAWTSVELSGYSKSDTVIDLTNSTFEGKAGVVATDSNENSREAMERKLLDLFTDEELSELLNMTDGASADASAESQEGAESAPEGSADAEGTGDAPEASQDAEGAPEVAEAVKEKVAVALSNENDDESSSADDLDIELANGGADAGNDDLRARLARAEAQLAESRFAAEKTAWTAKGVPPAFVDLAAPILKAQGDTAVVELSNAAGDGTEKVDAADVMRKMIDKLAGFVRVAEEQGHSIALSNETPADDEKTDELQNVWDEIAKRSKPKS